MTWDTIGQTPKVMSMPPVAECKDFELLFSKQDVVLSFSCEDLASTPEVVRSVNWLPDGWVMEFEEEGQPHSVRFTGAPEEILARVAGRGKLLVVGLRKSNDPLVPQIEISQEIDLPAR